MYRDFQSQNIIVQTNSEYGFVDFQDCFVGPIMYDVASLLKDCYLSFDQNKVTFQKNIKFSILNLFKIKIQNLVIEYSKNNQFISSISTERLIFWLDYTSLHRHIKAIGSFCRTFLSLNKTYFLPYISNTLHYIQETCKKYPMLKDFNRLLEESVIPHWNKYKENNIHFFSN